jgi:hypothetical protein
LDSILPYKGIEQNNPPLTFRSVLFQDRSGTEQYSLAHEFGDPVNVFIDQQMKFTKNCYQLGQITNSDGSVNLEDYSLSTIAPYKLKLRADYPWMALEDDKLAYGGGAALTQFCFLDCPAGYYYDYNSTVCRKCKPLCSSCRTFEKCDQCIPGLKLVQEPKHKELDPEVAEKQCTVGCQDGFYTKSFDGGCYECEQNCLSCYDDLSLGEQNEGGACSLCQDKDENDKELILNYQRKTCETECTGEREFLISREVEFKGKIIVSRECRVCEDPNCLKCQTEELGVCFECLSGYSLENDKCVEGIGETRKLILIFGGIFLGILGLMFGIIYLSKKLKKRKITVKKILLTFSLRKQNLLENL